MSRLKPIRVFWSPLSSRFYASRAYRQRGKTIIITGEKFDVTEDIASAVLQHDIYFTKKVIPTKEKL